MSYLVELAEEIALYDIDIVLVIGSYREVVTDIAGIILIFSPGCKELYRLSQRLGKYYRIAECSDGLRKRHNVLYFARDPVLYPRLIFKLSGKYEVCELVTA